MHMKETTERFLPLSKVKLSVGDKREILNNLRAEMTTSPASGRRNRQIAGRRHRGWMPTAAAAVAGVVIVGGALAAAGDHWLGRRATTANQLSNYTNVINRPQTDIPTMDNTVPVRTASSEHPMSIQFINDKVGYAAGYKGGKFELLKTIDGGAQWGQVALQFSVPGFDAATYGSQGPGYAQTYFVDAKNGWIAWIDPAVPTSMQVAHTTDGAKTWSIAKSPALPTGVVNVANMDFSNAQTGWILVTAQPGTSSEHKYLYNTVDGGNTWIPTAQPGFLPYSGTITAMNLVSGTSGWIVTANPSGPQPVLLHIRNGNADQPQHQLQVPVPYQSWDATEVNTPVFSGSNGVLPVGYYSQNQHRLLIYQTQNGGQSWTPTTPQGLEGYQGNAVVFTNTEDGWTTIGQVLYQTSNGGATWHAVDSVQLKQVMQTYPVVSAIDFVNSEVGWMILRSADYTTTQVLKTTDGGKTWTVQ